MTERNQVRRFFAGHDPGYSCDSQYIAFLMSVIHDQSERFRLHFDIAFGDGSAVSDRLVADVDHMSFAGVIKVG